MAHRTRFLIIGFAAGALTMFAAHRAQNVSLHDFVRIPNQGTGPALHTHMNEEFEAVERRLRGPRNREWNLLQDMEPCFPGSKLCFLLSGPATERGH